MKRIPLALILLSSWTPLQDDDIQKLLDEASKTGGVVKLEPRTYTIKTSLRIPTGVALVGSWEMPHHSEIARGTTLLAAFGRGTEEGPALIELSRSSAVRGVTILYPDQKASDIRPYPWAIHGADMHCTVENVTLVNAYNGISMGPQWNELHVIRNVFGCVLRRGISIDHTTDIGRIENVHFNPHYWARSGHEGYRQEDWNALLEYTKKNLEAFTFGKTDWQYCTNTFVFGARVGYKFIKTSNGACNGQFSGIGADGGDTCVLAEAAQPYGLLIANGQFVSFGGHAVQTTESFDGLIQLSNCSFWGPIKRSAVLGGPGTATFHLCRFDDQAGSIQADAGSVTITACRFGRRFKHISVGPNVITANITNNTFSARAVVDMPEGAPADRFVVSGNVICPKK